MITAYLAQHIDLPRMEDARANTRAWRYLSLGIATINTGYINSIEDGLSRDAIFDVCLDEIRRSDVLIVDYSKETDLYVGVTVEFGMAAALHKPVYIYATPNHLWAHRTMVLGYPGARVFYERGNLMDAIAEDTQNV